MTRLPLHLLIIAVLALVATACGSDDSASTEGETTEEVATATEPAAEEAGETDDAEAATEAAGTGDRAMVVVTTTILGDVVGELAGDAAEVEVLLPPGADPHGFQLSAQQAELLREADLLVANGLGLEEGMIDALEAAEGEGVTVFEATSAIETIEFGGDGGHAHDDEHSDEEGEHAHDDEEAHDDEHNDEEGEHAHDDEEAHDDEHSDEEGEHSDDEHSDDEDGDHTHDHGSEDPHFWLDATRMATVVTALGEELADIDDTLEDAEWAARAEDLAGELTELDNEVEQILADVPEANRVLVTNHEALGYFADRYDFEVLATIVPGGSTLAEPSAADLAELVEAITQAGVPAIFAETTDPSTLAEVVAEEVGSEVEVAVLYTGSLSEEGGPAPTYAEFMRYNATTVADALG